MIPGTTSRTAPPGEATALWHLRLAMQADNDNVPMTGRGLVLGAALGVPLASTAALAACIRFML